MHLVHKVKLLPMSEEWRSYFSDRYEPVSDKGMLTQFWDKSNTRVEFIFLGNNSFEIYEHNVDVSDIKIKNAVTCNGDGSFNCTICCGDKTIDFLESILTKTAGIWN